MNHISKILPRSMFLLAVCSALVPGCVEPSSGELETEEIIDSLSASALPMNGTSWGWGNVSKVKLGGGDNVVSVAAGASVTLSTNFFIDAGLGGCPTCISQIVFGVSGGGSKQCVYSGAGVVTSSATTTLTAPTTPGTYYVWATPQWQFSCADALNVSGTGPAVGVLEVYADPYSWGWGNVSNVVLNGKPNNRRVRAAPGASVSLSESYYINAGLGGCPGCISQVVSGIENGSKACVYNGVGVASGSTSATLTAPSQPGIYKVWSWPSWQYTCANALAVVNDGVATSYIEVDSCGHDKCTAGAKLTGGCDHQCVADICATDSYCCTNAWDSICVSEVNSVCHQSCN